jgi:hypothetical protein
MTVEWVVYVFVDLEESLGGRGRHGSVVANLVGPPDEHASDPSAFQSPSGSSGVQHGSV